MFVLLISESDLSVRSKNALINAGYINTEEIYQIKESDLKKIKNLGEKSVKEIINFKPHNVQKYNLKNLSFNELKTKRPCSRRNMACWYLVLVCCGVERSEM